MYPMLRSELPWTLRVTMNNVKSEGVQPQRLANSSVFNVESAAFDGLNEMSLLNFDSYVCTILAAEFDSIRIGVKIM